MASKPCLPVSRKRRKGDNGRRNNNNNNNNNNNRDEKQQQQQQQNDFSSSLPVDFEDISTMDATEYLSRVVQQSKQLPDIMCRQEEEEGQDQQQYLPKQKHHQQQQQFVPIEGSAASLVHLVSSRTSILPPPTAAHLPLNNPSDWLDQTMASFSYLREYLDQQQTLDVRNKKQPVPPMKDRPAWHIFCLGEQEAHGNLESYFGTDEKEKNDSEDVNDEIANADCQEDRNLSKASGSKNDINNDDDDDKTPIINQQEESLSWRFNLPENGWAPTTSLLLQMDQVMVRRVLSHLAHYYVQEDYAMTQQRTMWLYALLARLEKPIHRNDASVLFGLLRQLTQTRAATMMKNDTDKNRELLARLNVLIVIVGIYFEQGGGSAMLMEPLTTIAIDTATTTTATTKTATTTSGNQEIHMTP